MPRLTVTSRDAEGLQSGVEVQVYLQSPDTFRNGVAADIGTVVRHTKNNGEAYFDLPATEGFTNETPYVAKVGSDKPRPFAMPNTNARLEDLITSPAPTSSAQVSAFQRIDTDLFTIARRFDTVTLTTDDVNTGRQVQYPIRAFQPPTDGISTGVTQEANGLRITEAGLYSVELEVAVLLQSIARGSWGIRIVRSNGLTGTAEVVHQTAITTLPTDGFTTGGEHYTETVQFPLSAFDEGDVIYAAIHYQGQNVSPAMTFILSAALDTAPHIGRLTLRRYKTSFGTIPLSTGIYVSENAPPSPAQGVIWFDLSQDPVDTRWFDGTEWKELLDGKHLAAILNSLPEADQIHSDSIQGQIRPPILTALPPTANYRPGDHVIVQAAGQTAAATEYVLTKGATRSLSNGNRIVFSMANGAIQPNTPGSDDNYQMFLGRAQYDQTHRRWTLWFDQGVPAMDVPDQLWMTGWEPGGAISALQVDPFTPTETLTVGGVPRRFKRMRFTSTPAGQAANQGPPATWTTGTHTWNLFEDIAASQQWNYKPATEDLAGQWIQSSGQGGGGVPEESFFTPSLPAAVRSAAAETQINIAAGTLSASHPFTVSNNGIVVAPGTDTFFAIIDYVLELNPTSWRTDANQGGNRLFCDIYWKQDGTILEDTRISHYIRGDERFAPGEHTLNGVFGELLEPGTYTLWIERTMAVSDGNTITGFEIVAANSDIHIVTPGGTGDGLDQAQVDARVFALVGLWGLITDVQNNTIPSDRLAPGGTDGQVLTRTATGQAWEDATGGTGGGQTSQQVIDEINSRVQAWARASTGLIPDDRLGTGTPTDGYYLVQTATGRQWIPGGASGLNRNQVDARIDDKVPQWARGVVGQSIPTAQLAPGGAVDEVLTRTATGRRWAPQEAQQGLDQAAVSALITSSLNTGVDDFARAGNTARIPTGKLATGGSQGDHLAQGASALEWVDGPASWARDGNADAIPANKLTNVPSGGGATVVMAYTAWEDLTDFGDSRNPLLVSLSGADLIRYRNELSFGSGSRIFRRGPWIQLPADYASASALQILLSRGWRSGDAYQADPGNRGIRTANSAVRSSPVPVGSWTSTGTDDPYSNFFRTFSWTNVRSSDQLYARMRGPQDSSFSNWVPLGPATSAPQQISYDNLIGSHRIGSGQYTVEVTLGTAPSGSAPSRSASIYSNVTALTWSFTAGKAATLDTWNLVIPLVDFPSLPASGQYATIERFDGRSNAARFRNITSSATASIEFLIIDSSRRITLVADGAGFWNNYSSLTPAAFAIRYAALLD